MRSILLIIILLNFNDSFAQKSEMELLKGYNFYVEKNIEMRKWNSKHYLSDGRLSVKENYWKNELRSRTEYDYDKYGNVKQEIETYNSNDGNINNVTKIRLEYENGFLVSRVFEFGLIEKYSDFDEFGNPRLIERIDDYNIWPYKEIFKYDGKGNIVESVVFSKRTGLNDETIHEKAITNFKYDQWNNVIEIHREFEPQKEFPIIMIGGPAKYEIEYFKYKYDKRGLWIKKFKTIDGKEYLIAKRKYKQK